MGAVQVAHYHSSECQWGESTHHGASLVFVSTIMMTLFRVCAPLMKFYLGFCGVCLCLHQESKKVRKHYLT